MNTKDQLRELSKNLNVEFETQDWGIINSSADRFEEFLNYFEDQTTLSNQMKYMLFELVLASYNDVMLEKRSSDYLRNILSEFLTKYAGNTFFEPILAYWQNLKGDDFPIADFLRQQINSQG